MSNEVLAAAQPLYALLSVSGVRLREQNDRWLTLRRHELGAVAVPDGQLVACDPFGPYDAEPFTRKLHPGQYPVEVWVAEFEDNGDQRVVAAIVRLSDEEPDGWEFAVVPGQDLSTLSDEQYFGYPVDAGTGCFASASAIAGLAALLGKHFDSETADDDPLSVAMKPTYTDTWDWANFGVGDGVTVVAFHSGYGDGSYPTFWGMLDGRPACAMTDFFVIDPLNATQAADR